jgi:hypothetical protein
MPDSFTRCKKKLKDLGTLVKNEKQKEITIKIKKRGLNRTNETRPKKFIDR